VYILFIVFSIQKTGIFIVCSESPRLTLAAQHLLRVRAIIVRQQQLSLSGRENQTWQQKMYHVDSVDDLSMFIH